MSHSPSAAAIKILSITTMSGAPPRGRGAGINKPAWLVAQEREQAATAAAALGTNAPPAADLVGDNNGGAKKTEEGENNNNGGADLNNNGMEERDQFGRSVGRGSGGSARDYHDDRSSSRGGGGSYRNDRRGGGGSRDDNRRHYSSHRDDRSHRSGGGGRRNDRYRSGGSSGGRRSANRSGIYFHSYEEERAWLEERRRKRRSRKSLFDVEPSPEQLAEEEARKALERDHLMMTGGMGMGATSAAGSGGGMMSEGSSSRGLQPQQTRHARRLYIGNIPDVHENDVHNFFRDAIRSSIIIDPNNPNPSHQKQYVDNDPIISVYINRERRCKYKCSALLFILQHVF